MKISYSWMFGVVIALFFLIVWQTPFVIAADANKCTCFCATKTGAFKISDLPETPDSCEQICKDGEYQVAVCAKTTRQFPSNNALCFDQKACGDQNGVLAKQQAPECPTGWTYCFPDIGKSPLKLSTRIGELDTVGDLGEYVSGVYKWMLSVAGFFAIVMTLIGGFQYVIGAASSEQVSKAKDRIKNGVIGMVLLFCVVLILQTVNPQLLKLEIPRPSKLRIINLAANSCEKLKEQGYELKLAEGNKEECGGAAEVVKGPKGTQVADGLTCAYTKCAKGACVAKGANAGGVCVECRYVSDGNPQSPGKPTANVCFGLTVNTVLEDGKANYCSFGKGGFAGIQGLQTSTDVDFKYDSCFEVELDCSKIENCESYDDLPTHYFANGKLETNKLFDVNGVYLGALCVDDPCKKAPKGKKCKWDGDEDCDNVDLDD